MKTVQLKPNVESAFTRLELIACVVTVCIFVGLAAPAFARGQTGSQVIGCLANKQKLIAAWNMFIADREGKLPGKHTITLPIPHPTEPWVSGIVSWDTSQDNTNIARLNQRRNSSLAPYLGGNVEAFRCPADVYISPQQRSRGWTQRVRSVAANVLIGEGDEWNPDQGTMRSVRKASEMTKPAPADTWVFIDEHPDSINDGAFFPPGSSMQWSDFPAAYHQRGAGIAMADGSVEMHRWQSRRLELEVRFGNYLPPTAPGNDNADLVWLRTHTPQR